MDMPATASITACRPYWIWLEMAMIEPITGKVEKMPDQWLPMDAANWVITTVRIPPAIMRAGDRATAVKRIKEMANERMSKQPLAQPNTGSIFRHPPGDHAGRLIEAAGLKGATEGGAMVSTKHANFIVNIGDATAADVSMLMQLAQREVKAKFGVDLVPEVEMVGEW